MTHIGGDPLGIPATWTFRDGEIAKHFDRHVREQLPWYDFATNLTVHIARGYLQAGSRIYDIGAGTGNIAHAISETVGDRRLDIVSIEPSVEMTRGRDIPGRVVNAEIEGFTFDECDVVVSFLTLVFIHPSKRAKVLRNAMSKIRSGGCLIIVERFVNGNEYLSTVFQRLAWAMKAESTPISGILEKDLSIHGVQRPIYPSELPDGAIEFFRAGDFAGYVVEVKHGTTD